MIAIFLKLNFKIYIDPNITYRFPINNRFLSDIINKWKFKTNRFSKSSVLDNKYDYNNNLILREFRSIFVHTDKHNYPINYEYISLIHRFLISFL